MDGIWTPMGYCSCSCILDPLEFQSILCLWHQLAGCAFRSIRGKTFLASQQSTPEFCDNVGWNEKGLSECAQLDPTNNSWWWSPWCIWLESIRGYTVRSLLCDSCLLFVHQAGRPPTGCKRHESKSANLSVFCLYESTKSRRSRLEYCGAHKLFTFTNIQTIHHAIPMA